MENIDIKQNLIEDTSTPNAPEIATTDENLSVNVMYQQTALPSLGRQIFSVIPMNGPTAALFNIRKKAGANDFELVRADVEVENSESISTGISQEAIQDLRSQHGKEADSIIGTLLRGLANDQENTATLAFLEAECKDEADLDLSDSTNATTIYREVTQRAHELVLKANSLNQRTYEAFVVVPYIAGAAFAAMNQAEESGLFLAKVGKTKIFMNPDATSITAYVGLVDTTNPSKSAGVFSPYRDEVVEAINPDSGEATYHIYNRFAVTASPLHATDNEMMFKFDINV